VKIGSAVLEILRLKEEKLKEQVRQQDAYLATRPAMTNKYVSRTDKPAIRIPNSFSTGNIFHSVSTGRVKKLHTLLVSLYF